jgi:hypothetical protein
MRGCLVFLVLVLICVVLGEQDGSCACGAFKREEADKGIVIEKEIPFGAPYGVINEGKKWLLRVVRRMREDA